MNINKTNTKKSIRDLWSTPPWFVNQVADILKVKFLLDPCCSEDNKKAPLFFDEKLNGLAMDWAEDIECWMDGEILPVLINPAVWVNPPFSQLALWTEKIIKESQKGLTICLVHPDLSDPDWSQKIEDNCFLQLVPRKRLNYINPETGEPADSIPFNSCVSVFNGMPNKIVQRIRFDLDKPVKQKVAA